MSPTVKIAIIGLGNVSDYQLQAIKSLNEFRVVAACDINAENIKKVSDGILFFNDYEEMLKTVEIDSVLISTPPQYHYKIAYASLEANKNVLLEKPATSNLDEFVALRSLAKLRGLTLVVAFHASFAKDLKWFIKNYKLELSKELGPLTSFRCNFYDPYIENGLLLKKAERLGGSWFDSGINALSVIGKLVAPSDLELEEATLTIIPSYKCKEIQGTVNLNFPIDENDKAGRGVIDTNWTLGLNCKISRLYFDYTKNEILLDHSRQSVFLIDKNKSERLLSNCSENKERLVNHYIGVFENFYNCLNDKSDNLEHTFALHKLLFNAYDLKKGPAKCL